MPSWPKQKYGVYGPTRGNIEFGKPTGICSMIFPVMGIK
jgi:hypothetical protein